MKRGRSSCKDLTARQFTWLQTSFRRRENQEHLDIWRYIIFLRLMRNNPSWLYHLKSFLDYQNKSDITETLY